MSLLLLFRSPQGTRYASHWGPHFPRRRGLHSYWNRHFPDEPSTLVDPVAPSAPASFGLLLANNATITFSWRTGVFKSYSGKERRSSSIDDPAWTLEGAAHLVGSQTRSMRAQLARRAAAGLPFLLGLPYEEMAVRATASGAVVPVYTTAKSDWCLPGQRVYVVHQTHGTVLGVIQSVTADTITLDVEPGAAGNRGARVVPVVPVYLDPQQGFARYPTAAPDPVETMQIKARLANAGFAANVIRAVLPMFGHATSGVLYGLALQAREAGAGGNDIEITQVADATDAWGSIDEDTVAKTLTIHYKDGATTTSQWITLADTSELVRVIGTPAIPDPDTSTLTDPADSFTENLADGEDAAPGEVGVSATVAEWAGRPVWDRGLNVDGSVPDTLMSMTQVTDLGGLPLSSASATYADWGRTINASGDLVDDWQWLRRMLDALRGSWRGFWLTTGRADLVPTAVGSGTLTVDADDGDLFAWWPLQRTALEIVQADSTVTRVRIDDATPASDTVVLAIVDEDDLPVTLSGSAIVSVSWLEVCRLETDQVRVAVSSGRWETSIQGRAIQDLTVEVETEIRDGVRITHGTTEYLFTTSTRAVEIDGTTYPPQVAGCGNVTIHTLADDQAMELHVPVSHPLAQRYMAGGVPPREIFVEIKRDESGSWGYLWRGWVTSMSVDGHIARFVVPSEIDVAVRRRLPVLSVGKLCGHVLYNADCRADRATFTVTSTISSRDGRNVVCDVALDDQWARGGELVHVPTGERMSIFEHQQSIDLDGPHASLTLQDAIYGMQIGDAVSITAGCPHDVETCRLRFNNVPNFGGFPEMPTVNPFKPSTRQGS